MSMTETPYCPSSNTIDRPEKYKGRRTTTATSAINPTADHETRARVEGAASVTVMPQRQGVNHRSCRAVLLPSVDGGVGDSFPEGTGLAKHVFVTGGVASSLGKGLTASSLGRLLKNRGLRVTMQKLDPYINVDPGTMNPFQHGEVFVTDDKGETDLDLGHYERFVDVALTRRSNATTG